jgi:hypothetical protein
VNDVTLRAYVTVRAGLVSWRSWANERGEGVISAAIAVLIMAFLGAGMWLAFTKIFDNTARNACEQTARIGDAHNSTDCSDVTAEH